MSVVDAERPVKSARKPIKKPEPDAPQPPTWLQLESVIPLETEQKGVTSVRTVTSLTAETVAVKFPELIIKLTERRRGMKLKHALQIAEGMKDA